jgi:hypothetical protein
VFAAGQYQRIRQRVIFQHRYCRIQIERNLGVEAAANGTRPQDFRRFQVLFDKHNTQTHSVFPAEKKFALQSEVRSFS